jgi:class 3 adenylate cyclase
MTILFSDIRAFTTLSERMTPEENFRFINAYLSQMGPIVREYHGFIDKYIGDAIMALFACADDAVDASLAMLQRLTEYNQTQHHAARPPIRIGIGLNTGKLMLGIIGEEHRMEGTVISDAVNLASRIEGMTKMYGASLLISEHTFRRLSEPERYLIRLIDRVAVKGKAEPVTVYEILNGEPKDVREKKESLRKDFDYAVRLYQVKKFEEAKNLFESCLLRYPEDKATTIYIARCEHHLQYGCDDNWDGVMHLESKEG